MAFLRKAFGFLLALVILFEEWGWEPLQHALARLAAWMRLAAFERWLARLPPYAALAVFAVPGLLLLPVKLAAVALITRGHALLGLVIIVVAKLGGTAVVARLFSLMQPQLMKLAWFARLHARWLAWKEALLAEVRSTAVWKSAQRMKGRVKAAFARGG